MTLSIATALRGWLSRPLRSLTSRLIVSVFSAALISSLVVTWTSTRSTESFLRSNIEEQFPELLHTARQRLELWYAQRELDIATFAASDTVAELVSRPSERTRVAADRYLGYVLDAFPQYTALFVRREDGSVVLWSGEEIELGNRVLERLAQEKRTGTLALSAADGTLYQIVSAPVETADDGGGFLHGLVSPDALHALATELEIGGSRRLFILDGADGLVLQTGSGVPTGKEPPSHPGGSRLGDYLSEDGRRVVGSALAFERFGWTLVIEDDYEVAFAPVVSAQREVLSLNLAIVALFGLLAYRIARSVSNPILALSHEAQRIAAGESEIELPQDSGLTEIRALASALDEMMSRVAQKQAEANHANDRLVDRNAELSHANEMLAQLSITDGLTRLHNHRHFQERMALEARTAQRSGSPLSLLLIDIDHFKSVNDRFGHDVGDQVLRRISMVIHNLSRETDLPARHGGEEFAVLAPHTHLEGALDLAERIRMGVHQASHRFQVDGETVDLTVTVSVGCATLQGADVKRLFTDADSALYAAKSSGRDCVMSPPET
jgi:diguanylate cyclase (GGDEF)-like protein